MRASYLLEGPADSVARAWPEDDPFDFVYLDPPYGVGTTMTARTKRGEGRGARHASSGPAAYEDPSDRDALVGMIAGAVEAIRARMAPHATLALHLDHRAVHEAKVACDALLGRGAFLGEIVWSPGNGARGRGVAVTHQTILLYAKSPSDARRTRWDAEHPALREPYAATSLAMHFNATDEHGRRYRERVVNGRAYRYYADHGRRLGSVWTDVPAMIANTPLHAEATGYPTQKPLRLLERFVHATTREGELVADLMCGSGTTLAAAARLGRRFVGGDASPLAIATATQRLEGLGIAFERGPSIADAHAR